MTVVESRSPDQTFAFGQTIGSTLVGGDIVLLVGGLGAGKTLLTKGILDVLDYDVDDVTSPSFTLVNLYQTPQIDVYHIDLWRLESRENAAEVVGLDEILENDRAAAIIEWADRLGDTRFDSPPLKISISGNGDEPRRIEFTGKSLAKI